MERAVNAALYGMARRKISFKIKFEERSSEMSLFMQNFGIFSYGVANLLY